MRALSLSAVVLTLSMAPVTTLRAQPTDAVSCDDLLPVLRSVSDSRVGPESCLVHEAGFTMDGREYARVDLGLDDTAEGIVIRDGTYHEYLSNGPDLIFEQAANHGERLLAIARYERARGAAILLARPADPAAWNGKLFVTAHGRGRSFRNGALRPWNRSLDRDDPPAAFDWVAFNDNAAIIMDFALVAEAALERRRLGTRPTRTYLYGHSAGARIGRSLNYTPGLNADARGPVFDGFLLDDSATGLWLTVVMRDGRDVLFDTDTEREAFRPQVEVVHQMYNKIWERAPDRPSRVSNS